MKKTIIGLTLLALASCGSKKEINSAPAKPNSETLPVQVSKNYYQIGSLWSREKVDSLKIEALSSEEKSLIQSTVKVRNMLGHASGFYLGKHAGYHLVAVSLHSIKRFSTCGSSPFAKKFYFHGHHWGINCKRMEVSIPEVDLAILSLKPISSDLRFLETLTAAEVDFKAYSLKGEPLLTAGYGRYQNDKYDLTLNRDSDCKTFSSDDSYRLLKNPDKENAGTKKVWSVATGCDVSHGDSGSPVVSKKTGKIIGMVWATKSPKPLSTMAPNYLERIYNNNDRDIWKNLTYVVPTNFMASYLRESLKDRTLDRSTKNIIRSLLGL